MRLLATSASFSETLLNCQRRYRRWSWAVAWASVGFSAWNVLRAHLNRVHKFAIGTHFYQTHPDVLDAFAGKDHVHFVLNPSGVFHPKIYLFENGPHDWACICGSANFTEGGTTSNTEAALFIDGRDAPESLRSELVELVDSAWKLGKVPTAPEREYYRTQWRLKQDRLAELGARFTGRGRAAGSATQQPTSDGGRELHQIPLVRMTWSEFVSRIKKEDRGKSYGPRLDVLDAGHDLFAACRSFADLDPLDRQRIAGFVGASHDHSLHWKWFGSIQGAGHFKKLVNDHPERIARAIDNIPLTGPVTRNHFDRFVHGLKGLRGVSLGAGTRLLTLKRPDTFVPFNAQNRELLCQASGLPANIDWRGYWDSIIGRIHQAIWFQSPLPPGTLEQRVWSKRAAMLDALYYDADH